VEIEGIYLLSLVILIISIGVSWYVLSLASSSGPVSGEVLSGLMLSSAGIQLWTSGPNSLFFGMIIGSGWFLLNAISDLILPLSAE